MKTDYKTLNNNKKRITKSFLHIQIPRKKIANRTISNFEEPLLIKLIQKRQLLILSLKIIQRWKKNYKSVQISRRQIVNQTISNFEESLFIKLIQKRQSLILSLKIVQLWKKNYRSFQIPRGLNCKSDHFEFRRIFIY